MFSLKNIDERIGQQPATNKNIKSTKSIQFRDTSEIFYVINNEQKENFNECCAIMWECIQLFILIRTKDLPHAYLDSFWF